MMLFASLLTLLTNKGLPFRVSRQFHNPQVYTQGPAESLIWHGFRNVQGHRQIEGATAGDEIGLSLDGIHAGLLVVSHLEGNQGTARKRQKRDSQQALKAHDPFIVDDSPKRREGRLDALIPLIGLDCLANSADCQFSSKFVGGTQFSIHQLLPLYFVCHLFSKRQPTYVVA